MNKSLLVKSLTYCAIVTSCFLGACGDDSASAESDVQVLSSAEAGSSDSLLPTSSEATDLSSSSMEVLPPEGGEEPILSSSSELIVPVPEENPVHENAGIAVSGFAAARTLNVVADTNGFFEASEVYKAAPSDYKLVFVIRHSERLSSLGHESVLTLGGAEQAQVMGSRFVSDEKFFYASTDFIRTQETALNFAKGRGEEGVTVEKWERLNGGYFLTVSSDSLDAFSAKKGGSWKVIAAYAFGESYYAAQITPLFYPLKERGDQFVMENILPNMPSEYRTSVLVSHDVLMEPLVVYASEGTADVNFYATKKWVNYLSGIAIVVNASSEVELYPIRGYDVGYMTLLKPSESAAKDSTAAPLLGTY